MPPESLDIALLVHPDDPAPVWDPQQIEAQLRHLGHRAVVSDHAPHKTSMMHALGWAAGRAAADAACTFVLTPEGSVPDDAAAIVGSATAVLVPSRDRADVINRLGTPHFKITVLPVAVDCDVFSRHGQAARRTDRFRVLSRSCGSHGLLHAVELLSLLPGIELVVLLEQGAQRLPDDVESLARQSGVRSRIAAVRVGDEGERAWWLRSGDAVVCLDETDADGAFVAEAMACGTPVVATLIDTHRELVVHAVTGFAVRPGDTLGAARALREILSDDFTREAYGMAASDRALSRLDASHIAADLVAAYRRALSVEVVSPDDETVDDDRADADGHADAESAH